MIESDSQVPLCALAWRGECEVNTILWIKPDTQNTDAKTITQAHTQKNHLIPHTLNGVLTRTRFQTDKSGLNVEKNQKCELRRRV